MPRGIPGSGKVAKKPAAAAAQNVAVPPLPTQAKRKYTRRAAASETETVAAPKATLPPRYSDFDRFSAAQAYLLTLAEAAVKLNVLNTKDIGLGTEIEATVTLLAGLRDRIFGTSGSSIPEEVAAERAKGDERIRQNLPPPNTTHVGAPVHSPVVQQAPFVPGATPPRM